MEHNNRSQILLLINCQKTIRNHRSLLFNKNSNKLSLNYAIQCLQAWIVQGKGKYVHDLRIAQSVIEAKLIILTLFRVFRVDIFRAKNFMRNRNLYRKYSIIHIGIWDCPFVSEWQTLSKLCTSACLLSSIEL